MDALRSRNVVSHAGDVGKPKVLEAQRGVAPTFAGCGNVDRGRWAQSLPLAQIVGVGPSLLYVLPDLRELESDPRAAGFAAVISGHSHQPYVREENGVLYLNPASAGPRRFGLLVSVAEIPVGERLEARLIELDV